MAKEEMLTVVEPKYKRPEFPNLVEVLNGFVNNNDLAGPETIISTNTRGLIAYWDKKNLINLFSLSSDLSSSCRELYGLQGMLDGREVNLSGQILISPHAKVQSQVRYRTDNNSLYLFLGTKIDSS
jgi:hypothetical protein